MKAALDHHHQLIYAMKGKSLDTKGQYFCPKCHQVVQCCQMKDGSYYFRHKSSARHDGETQAHQEGKKTLMLSLKSQGIQAELEVFEEEIYQRPDISFDLQGVQWALEYQCSVISHQVMASRTDNLEQLGQRVWWILGETFMTKNLCDLSLYCMRYHPQLGNYLCFYGKNCFTLHHHITLNLDKRSYHFEESHVTLEQLDWHKMLRLYENSMPIHVDYQQGDYYTAEELQLFLMTVQEETRSFLEELYQEKVLCYALPSILLQKPKYSWAFKSSRLIWQGYLWLKIRKHSSKDSLHLQTILDYLQLLIKKGKIRKSTCYSQESVMKQEVLLFLEKLCDMGELIQEKKGEWQRKLVKKN